MDIERPTYGRRFCLGDIHGAYLALSDALNKANFNYEKDLLIFLGDVADGWSQTKECIDDIKIIEKRLHDHEISSSRRFETDQENFKK